VDRTQERRGSRQILAIERRRTRRARRRQFAAGAAVAQVMHVDDAGETLLRLTEHGWTKENEDGGAL
jgi:hypothetical protein